MSIDYQELKQGDNKEKVSTIRIDDLFDLLKSVLVFSKIDMRSRDYQVLVVKRDISKTAFRTWYKFYEFVVMPFDLTNALVVFIDLMNKVFQEWLDNFIMVFINTILVYFRTQKNHEQYLKIVLQRLRDWQLYVEFSKCEFWLDRATFLGHMMLVEGIWVDLSKIKVVIVW